MTDMDASTITVTSRIPTAEKPTSIHTIDPPGATPVVPWYRRRGFLLLIISAAQMLDIINVASVTIALPSILRDVKYEPNQLQWVVSSYALTYSAFLLVGGRLGDLFGHRRIFLTGTLWFSLWSLVCGFARNPIFMSVARGIQGAGAGFTIPSALALLTTNYPLGPERTFALSMFGGAACMGQTIGVLLGGIFDATIGWYWIFFVTAIISLTLAVGGFFIIPARDEQQERDAITDRRIDYFGVFSFMLGIIAIIYYLSESTSSGWGSAKTLPVFIVGLISLGVFVFWENRVAYPIMPFHIWKSRRFASACVIIIVVTATYNTMIFFTSLTFQNVLKFNSILTACCYIVHGAGLMVGLYTVTKLYLITRSKVVMLIGWLFISTSAVILAQIIPTSTYWQLAFPAFIVNCLGLSPTWMSCQVNAVADAKDEDQGVVGAAFNVAMQLGGPIGLAIATIISEAKTHGLEPLAENLMPGYSSAFYAMAVMGGVGFVITLVLASNVDPIEFSGRSAEEVGKALGDVEAIAVGREDKKEVVEVEGEEKGEVGEQMRVGNSSTSSFTPTIAPENEEKK